MTTLASLFTLENINTLADKLPFASAVDFMIKPHKQLIGKESLAVSGLFNLDDSVVGPVIDTACRTLFALFFLPPVTPIAAKWNLGMGTVYLVMGCVNSFRIENKTDDDQRRIDQQFRASFTYLVTGVYDFAIGYFLTTRLALFGALAFGIFPTATKDFHHKFFKSAEPLNSPSPDKGEAQKADSASNSVPIESKPEAQTTAKSFRLYLAPECQFYQFIEKCVEGLKSRPQNLQEPVESKPPEPQQQQQQVADEKPAEQKDT
jgi:hypothetical protein